MRFPASFRTLALPLVALALLGAAWAPPCLAGEDAGHGEDPSLLDVDLPVAGATIVVFALLLFILTKTAWKPILSGLKAREEGIRSAIEGAEKANADAKALLAEHQKKMAAATEEARAIVEEGRRDAEALRSKIEADAKTEAAKERDRTLRDIAIAKDGALKEIYDRVAEVSTEVAGKILQQRLDPAQHRRLVDEAVASYERSRKGPGARA